MVSSEIKQIVDKNLFDKFNLAKEVLLNESFSLENMSLPTVSYNLRGGNSGVAYLFSNNIRLNRELIVIKENFETVSEKTLYHELAHLIVFYLENTFQFNNFDSFGNIISTKPHGNEWKFIMSLLGEEPTVTHNMTVKKRLINKIGYLCGCSTHYLVNSKHQHIQSGAKFVCNSCGCSLKLDPASTFVKM